MTCGVADHGVVVCVELTAWDRAMQFCKMRANCREGVGYRV